MMMMIIMMLMVTCMDFHGYVQDHADHGDDDDNDQPSAYRLTIYRYANIV